MLISRNAVMGTTSSASSGRHIHESRTALSLIGFEDSNSLQCHDRVVSLIPGAVDNSVGYLVEYMYTELHKYR